MSTNATPDVPAHAASDAGSTPAEPAWIEIGSPKRRTNPPAWSDELTRDAWDAPDARDGAVHAAAPGRFELVEPAASADDPAVDDSAVDDPAVDEPAVDAGADTAADIAANPGSTEKTPHSPTSPSLRGIRLRRVPRATARPFRRPAARDSAGEGSPHLAAEDAMPADLWVQEPAGEPTPSTHEFPVLDAGSETHQEPVVESPEDPESAERWQVIRDAAPPAAAPTATPVPAPTPAPGPAASPEPVDAPVLDPEPVEQSASPVKPPAPQRLEQNGDPTASAEQGSRRAGTLGGALDLVLPDLQAHRSALILGLGTLVLSIWALVALPFPLKYSIDAALAAAGASATAPTGIGEDPGVALLLAAGALTALVALQAGFRALSVSVLNRMGGRAATDLRGRLLGQLHLLSPRRDGEDLDRTDSLLITDVARLRDLVAHTGPRLVAGLLALASLTVMMLVVEPIAAAIVLVTAGLYALAARTSLSSQRRKEAAATADETLLAETADELLAATRTIQSYGLEERAQHSLAELGERSARSRTAARRRRAVGRFLGELVTGLGIGAALLLGGRRMDAGTMTPGELTMVIAAVLIAVVLAREVVHHSTGLRAIATAGDRIGELLERRAAITEPGRAQPLGVLRGEVVYSALSTAGPRGPLFENISLVIPAGQHVALVGREGAEASALLSYLLRFDQPDSGRVLLDRYDTRALALADLRSALAVVQRESALFSETVRENIRVGRPGATDDEIVEAARRSGADEFITLLPEGYDTILSRRGAALSDGQRRRIAITRALLRDAPVVMLDGADAELDPTEHDSVHRALDSLTAGRTVLISSDQPESVLGADRVLCFESGALAEDGAPAQLAEDPDSWLAAWIHAAGDPSR